MANYTSPYALPLGFNATILNGPQSVNPMTSRNIGGGPRSRPVSDSFLAILVVDMGLRYQY
jgi:hypothetical protein